MWTAPLNPRRRRADPRPCDVEPKAAVAALAVGSRRRGARRGAGRLPPTAAGAGLSRPPRRQHLARRRVGAAAAPAVGGLRRVDGPRPRASTPTSAAARGTAARSASRSRPSAWASRGCRSRFDYDDESDPGPYPIPRGRAGRGRPVIRRRPARARRRPRRLRPLRAVRRRTGDADGSWDAGSGAVFDLARNALRPDRWTSADAAGLPILPGLVRYDEVAAGHIDHAIRVTAQATQAAHLWPAHATTPAARTRTCRRWACDSGSGRRRIVAASPAAQVIARAMQQLRADRRRQRLVAGSSPARPTSAGTTTSCAPSVASTAATSRRSTPPA